MTAFNYKWQIINRIYWTFIYYKFTFQPYTFKSLVIFVIIIISTYVGYILPDIAESSMINLLYKGIIVSFLYLLTIFQLKLAPELFEMLQARIKKNKT